MISCNATNTENKVKKKIGEYLVEANFIDDSVINGTASYFNNSGILVKKMHYTNGKNDGFFINYFSDGLIKDSSNYVNNLRHGYLYGYDSIGRLDFIKYYYHGLTVGHEYFYNKESISSYYFTNFDKKTIAFAKYDSAMKCIKLDFIADPVTTDLSDETGQPILGLLLYFPIPTGFNCIYSLELINKKKHSHGKTILNTGRIFLDTALQYPEDGWHYRVSAHLENIKDSINKVFVYDLLEKEK